MTVYFLPQQRQQEYKDDTYNHDLLDPYLEYQGDRLFITGTVPKGTTDSNWTKNKTGAVNPTCPLRSPILFPTKKYITLDV